ncbi:hypothetical protein QQG55_55365 [Brugia pahangi]
MVENNLKFYPSIIITDFILLMIIPINSINSNVNKKIVSRKMMEQSEILSVNRSKRFWTDAQPLKRHYPDFDDDQADC